MIAGVIGANSTSDAYFTAAEFFVLIDSTLLNALVIVLLNMYTKRCTNFGESVAEEFLANSFKIVFPITIFISTCVFFLSTPLSYIIGPGYNTEGRTILDLNIKYMALVPIFLSITSVCLVILRYEKSFFVVGLKSLFLSISGMFFVLVAHFTSFSKTNTLCFGYVLAHFLYMMTVCIVTRRHKVIRFGIPKWDNDGNKLLKMLIPLIISNGISKVSMMIDKIVCSTVGEGAVSCLTYSHTLYFFIEALFITNLSTILLSDFNELSAAAFKNKLAKKLSKTISTMILLLIPITIITVIYRYDIVRIVFMRGNFQESNVNRVGNLIMIYAIGFVPSVISNIYMNVHYAEGKTSLTMKFSLLSIGTNIFISILLSKYVGLIGIAFGTIISIVISAGLYSVSVRKYIPEYHGFLTKIKFIKIAFATLVCILITFWIHFIIHNAFLSFILGSITGMCSFTLVLLILKYEEASQICDIILNKLKSTVTK